MKSFAQHIINNPLYARLKHLPALTLYADINTLQTKTTWNETQILNYLNSKYKNII